MKRINELAICLAFALVGCNTQKQTTSPTLPEVSRWTGEYGGIDKSYDDIVKKKWFANLSNGN